MNFRVSDTEYLITFAGMIIVGALISLLVARAHEHADAAQIRENGDRDSLCTIAGSRGCSGGQFDFHCSRKAYQRDIPVGVCFSPPGRKRAGHESCKWRPPS